MCRDTHVLLMVVWGEEHTKKIYAVGLLIITETKMNDFYFFCTTDMCIISHTPLTKSKKNRVFGNQRFISLKSQNTKIRYNDGSNAKDFDDRRIDPFGIDIVW